jgi:hypothetical protein
MILVFIRKLPLPLRKRAGVRGNANESPYLPNRYHPHLSLPIEGISANLGFIFLQFPPFFKLIVSHKFVAGHMEGAYNWRNSGLGTSYFRRHSRENGNPGPTEKAWIPPSAGMTNLKK